MLPHGCGAFSTHSGVWIFGHFENGLIGEGNCVQIEQVGESDVYRVSFCFTWRATNGGIYEKGVKVVNDQIKTGLWLDGVWQEEVELRDNNDLLGLTASGRFAFDEFGNRLFGELNPDGISLKRGITIIQYGDIAIGNFLMSDLIDPGHFIEIWTQRRKGVTCSFTNFNVGVCYTKAGSDRRIKKYIKFYKDGYTEDYDLQ